MHSTSYSYAPSRRQKYKNAIKKIQNKWQEDKPPTSLSTNGQKRGVTTTTDHNLS
jgi:hypothetical protein